MVTCKLQGTIILSQIFKYLAWKKLSVLLSVENIEIKYYLNTCLTRILCDLQNVFDSITEKKVSIKARESDKNVWSFKGVLAETKGLETMLH